MTRFFILLVGAMFYFHGIVFAAPPHCDFDNDGYDDLAISGVLVLYGTDRGLSAVRNQVWTTGSPGIKRAGASDNFSGPLACGDFDRDGYSDLAVGAPDVGVVHILYGSDSGLSASGNQLWSQDSPGVPDAAEPDDSFGDALASGDFNGDGFSDLAISSTRETVGYEWAGAVFILYGSVSGISSANSQMWSQNSPGIADGAEPTSEGEFFGRALVAANFGKDISSRCFDDLAISVDEGFGRAEDAGAVHVIYGSRNGLVSTGSQFFHQNTSGIPDEPEFTEYFGYSLAAGVFRNITSVCGKKISDLAIGIPQESINSMEVGAVQVLYASNSGLSTSGNQLWHQNSFNVPDNNENGDSFGRELATGRTTSGRDYLAIGNPFESLDTSAGRIGFAGKVTVLFTGSTGKLTGSGSKIYHQNSSGIADSPEHQDFFGLALTTGNFNGFGTEDLVIGAPWETLNGVSQAGAVHVLYGAATTTTQFWHRNSPGLNRGPTFRFGNRFAD